MKANEITITKLNSEVISHKQITQFYTLGNHLVIVCQDSNEFATIRYNLNELQTVMISFVSSVLG